MKGRASKKNRRKLSLREQVLLTFALFLIGVSAVVYISVVSAARNQVNEIIQKDLQQVLTAASVYVDVEMLVELAETGMPNEEGFSDDPRYIALLDALDAIHQVEPDAWPYLYIPSNDPNEIIFVVDLIARYEPERAAGFMERYRSNSGFILIGLEQQVFRKVDAQIVLVIRQWGDHTNWIWLKNGLHGLAYWLADSAVFSQQEFGIYEDDYGRWSSGYMPIENDQGEKVAAVGVDFKAELIEEEYYKSRRWTFYSLLIFSVIPILLLVAFLRQMILPLDQLTEIATNIQQDKPLADKSFQNFSHVRTVDELEILAEVLEDMVEQLRQRERRYHAVIDAQDALILRTAPDGTFTFCNQAYVDLRGNPDVDTLENETGEGLRPDDKSGALRFFQEALPSITFDDPVRKYETRIFDRDGNLRWYLWTITGIFNENGELTEYQGVGHEITELKEIQEQLEKANQRLREISHDLINAAEQERSKIAREVHDDMLNYISELVLDLEGGDVPAEKVNHSYRMIAERLRETVYNLRPPMLVYGLNYGLKDYVDGLSDRINGNADIHFDLVDSDSRYPRDVNVHLFRIVQQACENAVDHANPDTIQIKGELLAESVFLVIEDDGIGFDWNPDGFIDESIGSSRFGLAGMFERALIIGAEVDIVSQEGAGTRVEIIWRKEEYQRIAGRDQVENIVEP